MRKQSTNAAAGSRIITACFTRPLQNGRIHAPAISRSPGWIHSGVIVVFGAGEPQLPQNLRDNDDHETRDQPVDRAPRRYVLEPEVRVVRLEETQSRDFADGEHHEKAVEPALDGHGNTLPASAST